MLFDKFITYLSDLLFLILFIDNNNNNNNINNNININTGSRISNINSNMYNDKINDSYDLSYYLDQSGMNYIYYNNGINNKYNNLWSIESDFGIIGCEMFPLQLKPGEYKDFILIFNYDLSLSSIYSNLYIKACHIYNDINNNVKKIGNPLYFKAKKIFNININLYNSISSLKPLEIGKIFIKKYTINIFILFILCLIIFLIFKLLQICFPFLRNTNNLFKKIKNFIFYYLFILIIKFITNKLKYFKSNIPFYKIFENVIYFIIKFITIKCEKSSKWILNLNILYKDIKLKLYTFKQDIIFEFFQEEKI